MSPDRKASGDPQGAVSLCKKTEREARPQTTLSPLESEEKMNSLEGVDTTKPMTSTEGNSSHHGSQVHYVLPGIPPTHRLTSEEMCSSGVQRPD